MGTWCLKFSMAAAKGSATAKGSVVGVAILSVEIEEMHESMDESASRLLVLRGSGLEGSVCFVLAGRDTKKFGNKGIPCFECISERHWDSRGERAK